MLNELVLMRPAFFGKREAKRDKVQNEAGLMDMVFKTQADNLDDQYKRVFSVKDKTAKIVIAGPLSPEGPDPIDVYFGYGGTSYKNIERAANEALELYENGDIDSVIVRMNTPGGTVDGVDAAHAALKKIGSLENVVVKNDGMIASAGVWLASAFDRIEATVDSAMIGSIGVVATYTDYTGYYNNFGIKVIDITNKKSNNKRPDVTTDEGFEVVQKTLDDLYNVFANKVTASRVITRKQIDDLKGEMVIASKAVELGLMDAPQNGDSQEKADAVEENKKTETEVSKVKDTEEKVEVVDNTATIESAIKAERERIFGLVKLSGIAISDDLNNAIESDVGVGAYALNLVDAKNKANDAEIEAAKKVRENAELENVVTDLKTETHEKVEDVETKKAEAVDDVIGNFISNIKGGR